MDQGGSIGSSGMGTGRSEDVASSYGIGANPDDTIPMSAKLMLASQALQGTPGVGHGGGAGLSGSLGGGAHQSPMPTLSSLDNLIRILQRQEAFRAQRQKQQAPSGGNLGGIFGD